MNLKTWLQTAHFQLRSQLTEVNKKRDENAELGVPDQYLEGLEDGLTDAERVLRRLLRPLPRLSYAQVRWLTALRADQDPAEGFHGNAAATRAALVRKGLVRKESAGRRWAAHLTAAGYDVAAELAP